MSANLRRTLKMYMKKNLKLLASSFVILAFLTSQIYVAQAIEKATPIVFIQPDGKKMAMKVDLDQPLSDLRWELIDKGIALTTDIFQWEGNDIFRDDEKNWRIRDAIKDNSLFFKPRSSISAVKMSLTVPLVARGYEEIYQRFLNGLLIYRPMKGSDVGMITLPISELRNPLEGTFDLSRCGDTGKYLSISTGYRKRKKPENAGKIEIWLAPRFLIEKELNTTAKHFQAIFPTKWNANAPVGMFWTWSGDAALSSMDYLTTESMNNLSRVAFNEIWKKRRPHGGWTAWSRCWSFYATIVSYEGAYFVWEM